MQAARARRRPIYWWLCGERRLSIATDASRSAATAQRPVRRALPLSPCWRQAVQSKANDPLASKAMTLKYRRDLDGLRAVAILPVIWFHSGLPGLPGGFTGVDTFFALSGYLITLIIHREIAQDSFSFARFYERRVRRIAPALLLILWVATITAFVLLLPYELIAYSYSAASALGMVSNIYFWRSANYFALADGITPLLHTWSLGVEEQFYLIFPAAMIIAERLRIVRPLIASAAAASFVMCLIVTRTSPAFAFYALPTRGWELMAGAAFAVGIAHIPTSVKSASGLIGLAMIAGAALLISGNDPFPGWRAVFPVAGAALVIGADSVGPAARLLSMPALVYIGRISYSLYLWHWPVFVFLRHGLADPELPPWVALSGILIAFLLAAMSYRFVENPARQRSLRFRVVALICTGASAVILAAIVAAILGRGIPQRLPAKVIILAERHNAFAPLAHSCTDIGFDQAVRSCHIGVVGRPALVLWGDSHAAALAEAVGRASATSGFVFSQGGCPPEIGWASPKLRGRDLEICRAFNARVLDLVEHDDAITTVVLGAFWLSYNRVGGKAFWRSQQTVIDRLRRDGKRVLVIGGIPDPGIDVPWASAIRSRFGRTPVSVGCPPAALPLVGAIIIDVSAGFCRYPSDLLFTDSNHISRFAGLAIVAPALVNPRAPEVESGSHKAPLATDRVRQRPKGVGLGLRISPT